MNDDEDDDDGLDEEDGESTSWDKDERCDYEDPDEPPYVSSTRRIGSGMS